VKTFTVASPENWAASFTVMNSKLLLAWDERHFLLEIELQQKGAAGGICRIMIFALEGCPFEWCVDRNGFVELSANNGNSIGNVVTFFIEISSP
jgi:hypothetical protein